MANASVERFKRRLARIPKVARDAANEEIEKQARGLVNAMRLTVETDTGNLRASIVYQMQELRAFVRAGGQLTTRPVRKGSKATYDYALANEFGTAEMPAQPFFWPTYRLKKKGIRSALARAMKKGIEKAAGQG